MNHSQHKEAIFAAFKEIVNQEEQYMRRCLDLAKRGEGKVSPNPMVGCVIVHEGKIIGEGWHQKFGEAHAEVNAINSVKEAWRLPYATLYVNLEPCAHFGKTPPCSDLIIDKKIPKVVIGCIDSFAAVAGKGAAKLRNAGVEVVTGVLKKESEMLNRRFFHFNELHKPYIVLKWAQTLDGFIARENGDSKWISAPQSRILVHRWRSEEAAILVGPGTAVADNPSLTVRDWFGTNPIRFVLDPRRALPEQLNLFHMPNPAHRITLNPQNEDDWVINNPENWVADFETQCYKQGIQSVLVEGGAGVLESFLTTGSWDEARVFTAPEVFKSGLRAPFISASSFKQFQIGPDTLHLYRNYRG